MNALTVDFAIKRLDYVNVLKALMGLHAKLVNNFKLFFFVDKYESFKDIGCHAQELACTNGGTCNNEGNCVCNNDFTGNRCEISACEFSNSSD